MLQKKGDIIKNGDENPNQLNFINFVSKNLGVNPNQEINLKDPKVMKEYAKLVATFEGHQDIQDSDLDKAIELAFTYRNIK
jgi:hypothetical protein